MVTEDSCVHFYAREILMVRKCLLDHLNRVHIWQMPSQQSCVATSQTRRRCLPNKHCWDNHGKSKRKWRTEEIGFVTTQPWTGTSELKLVEKPWFNFGPSLYQLFIVVTSHERLDVPNHQRLDSFTFLSFFSSKVHIKWLLALCEENPTMTGGFPSQMASNGESGSESSRGHDTGYHCSDVMMSAMASNHWRPDCMLNRLFRHRSKKTSKLRVTGLCEGNSPITGEFPAQMACNAENVSIRWRLYRHLVSCFESLLLQLSLT